MASVVLDMSKLLQIQAKMGTEPAKIVQKLAQDTELYIKNHWSTSAPSSPGEAPAVDTGNLTNSITAQPEGPLTWVLSVGAPYGADLEYGTVNMQARPYVLPAVEAIAGNAPKEMVKVVD